MMDPTRIAALRKRIASLDPTRRKALEERLVAQGIDPSLIDPEYSQAASPAPARPDRLPLSASQSRVWVLHQIIPGLTAYHIPFAWSLRGEVEDAALTHAFEALVGRHESLRTIFPSDEGGRPYQRVLEGMVVPVEWEEVPEDADSTAGEDGLPVYAHARAAAFANRGFELASGPLIRIVPIRMSADHVVVVVVLHHLIADGWSRGVFMRELAAFYRGALDRGGDGVSAVLPPLEWQYADHVLSERDFRVSAAARIELEYWKTRLEGLEPLEIRTGGLRPSDAGFESRTVIATFPTGLNEELKDIARRSGLTYFMFLLAAFKLLLYRYTGEEDLAVGVPVGGRTDPRALALIGFFVNTLVVRTRFQCSPDTPLSDWFGAVKESVVGALEHQRVPFADVVDACSPPRQGERNPFFEIMFQAQTDGYRTQNAAAPDVVLPGLSISQHAVTMNQTKFDMSWHVLDRDEGLLVAVEFRTSIFDDALADGMVEHFHRLLETIARSPDARLADLEMLSPVERSHVLGLAGEAVAPVPTHPDLPRALATWAEYKPEALAVCDASGACLSYADLDSSSLALAQRLVREGVRPEDRVGVCLPRETNLLVAMLGVLRSGAAFVPLDPSLPGARIRFMSEDAGCRLVLADEAAATGQADWMSGMRVVSVSSGEDVSQDPVPTLRSDQLAYVMYTSGSSGMPKGTMVHHGGLTHYLDWCCRRYPMTAGYGAPVHGSIGFDATLTALFAPIFCGETVCLLDDDDDLAALAAELSEPSMGAASIVKLTPAHLKALPPLMPRGLPDGQVPKAFVIGGEALLSAHLEHWRRDVPGIRLLNEYGPTEAVVGCCVHEVTREDQGNLPIGRPIDGVRLYVLDAWLDPCPVGIPGELYIEGPGVARGYLGRPRLTAERFVPHPFATEGAGDTLYRTGDRVVWRADGVLLYVGRLDAQVQLNGVRIELAEIEARLLQHQDVESAAVVLQHSAGTPQLVAFFSTGGDAAEVAAQLPEWLAETLPAQMRPRRIEAIDRVPLTVNGKVDRASLPQLQIDSGRALRAAETDVEGSLLACWREALSRDDVGLDDNLFELGGDSITGMQIIGLARKAGLVLTPRQLFENQTVAAQASVARPVDGHNIVGLDISDDPFPLSPIQWAFLNRVGEAPDGDLDHYNHGLLLKLTRKVEVPLVEEALRSIVAHHDSLRLRLRSEGEALDGSQEYGPVNDLEAILERADFSEYRTWESALEDRLASAQRRFDLASGRIFWAEHIALPDPEPDRLLLLAHHWAVDAWSMKLIVEDLSLAYRQLEQGEAIVLPPKTSSFAAWAGHLTESLDGIESAQRHWIEVCRPTRPLPWEDASQSKVGGTPKGVFDEVEVVLDQGRTQAILSAPEMQVPSGAEALLLTTLGQTVCRWAEAKEVVVDVEGHGRHAFAPGIDVSRTTGWFTSRHPVRIRIPPGVEAPPVESVREQIVEAPHQGVSFGLLSQQGREGIFSPAEIQLNFLGRLGSVTTLDSDFASLETKPLPALSALGNPSGVRVEVVAVIEDRGLVLRWRFRTADVARETVLLLAERHLSLLHSRAVRTGGIETRQETSPDTTGVDRGSLKKLLSRVGAR